MKRLILLLFSAFILAQANAQNQERSLFINVGGGASLNKKNETNKTSYVQLSTSFNYMLNNKWAIGLVAEHSRRLVKAGLMSVPVSGGTGYTTFYNSHETKWHSWFAGPQVRYYHNLTDKLLFFGEAQAGLRYESSEMENSSLSYFSSANPYYSNGTQSAQSYSSNKSEVLSAQAVASPGIVYFLKPRFGVELKTSLLHYNQDLDNSMLPDGAEQAKSFSADFSMANTKIGLSYYF